MKKELMGYHRRLALHEEGRECSAAKDDLPASTCALPYIGPASCSWLHWALFISCKAQMATINVTAT